MLGQDSFSTGADYGPLLTWLFVGAVILGIAGAAIGDQKGRMGAGFLLGFLLGPLGLIIIAVMEPSEEVRVSRLAEQARLLQVTSPVTADSALATERKCPWCAERVLWEAIVCRYCGRDLDPIASCVVEWGIHPDDFDQLKATYGDDVDDVLGALERRCEVASVAVDIALVHEVFAHSGSGQTVDEALSAAIAERADVEQAERDRRAREEQAAAARARAAAVEAKDAEEDARAERAQRRAERRPLLVRSGAVLAVLALASVGVKSVLDRRAADAREVAQRAAEELLAADARRQLEEDRLQAEAERERVEQDRIRAEENRAAEAEEAERRRVERCDLSAGFDVDQDLHECDLPAHDFSGKNWDGANFSSALLGNADFHDDDLGDTDIYAVDFSDATLGRANFAEASIWETNFARAILPYANFRGAFVVGAKGTFKDADLVGVNFSGAHLEVTLDGVDLSGADLSRAELQSSLKGANLTGANLTGAELSFADLTGANLTGANLTDAELGAADLDGAILDGARASPGTRWPEGFDAQARGVAVL